MVAPQGIYGLVPQQWTPVPKLPPLVIFTDRDDGTLWLLTHSADEEHISITDNFTLPRYSAYTIYPPDEGPCLTFRAQLSVRLLVRGGNLGWEEIALIQDTPRVLTRRGAVKVYKQLYIPEDFKSSQRIAWHDWLGDISG